MSLIPLPEESQPQFAIRFHTAMAGAIPSANQRNVACMNAWRKSGNARLLSRMVESRFPTDQYRRVPSVNHFEEHVFPASKGRDGEEVPPKVYGRDELAAMVEGMNSRIIDHEHFPPLSEGHTVFDKSGAIVKEPAVLGYTGPFFLGQVGDVNPRWGIFGDEHHMVEAVPILNRRRGRSPEVWPYQNARDRFFHPVAALGSEMPRGNLIPARYSRTAADGQQVMVEFYTNRREAVMSDLDPDIDYEDTDFAEDVSPDQYSQFQPGMPTQAAPAAPAPQDQGGGDIASIVQEIIAGLMETPEWQTVMQIHQQLSAQSNQSPMGGGNQFAQQQQAAPAAPAPAAPPQMPRQYSRQLDELRQELCAVRKLADEERQKRQRVERYSRLSELTSDFIVDPDEELERVAGYSDAQFSAHCQMIQDRYQRNPAKVPDFYSLSNGAGPDGPSAPEQKQSISKVDADAIGALARDKGLRYGQARDLYMRQRLESGKSSAVV